MEYKSVIQKINFYLGLIITFCFSLFPTLLPSLIFILLITWLLEGDFKHKFSKIKNKTIFFLLMTFYLLHILGLIYTNNMKSGWFDIQVKFTLLLFPLLFIGCNNFYKERFPLILKTFIAGCFTSTLFCLALASYKSGLTDFDYFFYTKFSVILHPSYFSMYLGFSVLILFSFLLNSPLKKLWVIVYSLLILFFLTIIFLLSSKAGIIGIYLSLILLLLFRLIKSSIRWSFVLILLSVIVLFFISFKANKRFESFPSAFVNAEENSRTDESSAVRILIWQSALDLIKHNYLTGVGTGDVRDSLMSEYKQRNMTGAYKQRLNVHNQFLETFVGQGILGDIILLLLLIYPFIQSLKKQNYLFALFLLLIGINFLFESMLNRQAGVLFFAFFYSYFIFVEYKEKFSV